MSQAYRDPKRENDPYALPDVEVFELTATEVAASSAYEDEHFAFMRRPEFRLAAMNGRVREAMFDAMVEELGITSGWFWWSCSPGCLPESTPFGPFATKAEALADAQDDYGPRERQGADGACDDDDDDDDDDSIHSEYHDYGPRERQGADGAPEGSDNDGGE